MSTVDHSGKTQAADFNRELGHRLASLDRGEHVDPTAAREGIEAKSQARRKTSV